MSEERTYVDEDSLRSRTIVLASSLPLHPAVKAAMKAVEQTLRRDFGVNGHEARQRVRVEITHEVETELRSLISPSNYSLAHDPRGQIGPMKIMGVSFYVVRQLPEPGWRVIG